MRRMVNHQGAARRNDRKVATTAISSPSMVALILVVFLGACLSLSESSPTGLDHGGADAGRCSTAINSIKASETPTLYYKNKLNSGS